MLTYHRTIYEAAPPVVEIPPELQERRVEVIVLALDGRALNGNGAVSDALGWPAGFFEETYGSIPDFPERQPQGDYEIRDELE